MPFVSPPQSSSWKASRRHREIMNEIFFFSSHFPLLNRTGENHSFTFSTWERYEYHRKTCWEMTIHIQIYSEVIISYEKNIFSSNSRPLLFIYFFCARDLYTFSDRIHSIVTARSRIIARHKDFYVSSFLEETIVKRLLNWQAITSSRISLL